jgi:hypothetical protein
MVMGIARFVLKRLDIYLNGFVFNRDREKAEKT